MNFHTSVTSWRAAMRLVVAALVLAPVLAACGGSFGNLGATVKRAAFTSKEYGVGVSPRVTRDPNPPRGGGRYMIGRPYTVRGQTYTPREQPGYQATGTASWYGADFHGRRTANGEIFSANAISGAHPTLPLPSYVRVTNLENGRSVMVRVNDRGPYVHGRVVDLSHRAASLLGYVNKGMTNVRVDYVGPAPLEGDDTGYLIATLQAPNGVDDDMRVAMQGGGTQRDPRSVVDYAGDFIGLFGYAPGGPGSLPPVAGSDSAYAAATGMAMQTTIDAAQSPNGEENDIALGLGTFSDPVTAEQVASAFALLGAVDEADVTEGGQPARRLTLLRLRPGVGRADVFALGRQLGLSEVVLY